MFRVVKSLLKNAFAEPLGMDRVARNCWEGANYVGYLLETTVQAKLRKKVLFSSPPKFCFMWYTFFLIFQVEGPELPRSLREYIFKSGGFWKWHSSRIFASNAYDSHDPSFYLRPNYAELNEDYKKVSDKSFSKGSLDEKKKSTLVLV